MSGRQKIRAEIERAVLAHGVAARQSAWAMLYLGAFAALEIENIDAIDRLVAATGSDDEAFQAIELMRAGHEGDRVYPALNWLRGQRSAAAFRETEAPPAVVCALPPRRES